jgi:hypothetical protein
MSEVWYDDVPVHLQDDAGSKPLGRHARVRLENGEATMVVLSDPAPASSLAQSELVAIQKAAENWITGVTALLGLFSVSGLVFAREAVKEGITEHGWLFSGPALAALVFGFAAIFFGYHAAHGWPSTKNLRQDRKPRWAGSTKEIDTASVNKFFSEALERAWQSVMALRASVLSAFIALSLLVAALAISFT